MLLIGLPDFSCFKIFTFQYFKSVTPFVAKNDIHQPRAQFCCKMRGGQLVVKPICYETSRERYEVTLHIISPLLCPPPNCARAANYCRTSSNANPRQLISLAYCCKLHCSVARWLSPKPARSYHEKLLDPAKNHVTNFQLNLLKVVKFF